MADVKWIKFVVGMFDGQSFKRIKKARIGGVRFRNALTAIWFELLDLSAKSNSDGFLIDSNEIPFKDLKDIAIMLDRADDDEFEEFELCMSFYKNEKMIEIIDDCYRLSNWSKYQNTEGLNKIREQTRLRVTRHREQKRLCNASVTRYSNDSNETDIDIDKELDKKKKGIRGEILSQDVFTLQTNIILGKYNEIFNRKTKITGSRQTKLKARAKEYGEEQIIKCFEIVKETPFLMGVNDRKWAADLDWLIGNDTNIAKVLEGKYGNAEPAERAGVVVD